MASAEFDLLCLAVRLRPDLARLRDRIAAGVDFKMLLDLADAYGVQPALLLSLGALSWEGVPDWVCAELKNYRQLHFARNLALADEACRVAHLFSAEGIRFAVFKGPALAAYLYGDLSRRCYNDIDMIVPPEQMARAEALLAPLGYSNRQGDRTFRQAFLSFQRQYAFVRHGLNSAIDLHWHFSARHVRFPVQPEEIWPSLVPVQVGACAIPSLADADLALLLAGHGTKESWKSLAWVCDFAMLIERKPDIDWSVVHRRARRQRCGDAVLLGCAMAESLLATPVPAALSTAVTRSARVQRIAATLIASMRQGVAHFPEVKPNFIDIELCERKIDRLRFLVSLAITPTPADYHALPLPRVLWSAYYLIRPLRQILKAVRQRT